VRAPLAVALGLVGSLALSGALMGLDSCTPAQGAAVESAAASVAGPLDAGCTLLMDSPLGAPYLDFGCATAEAVDGLLEHLSGATVVSAVTVTTEAGTHIAQSYRVRVPHMAPMLRMVIDAGSSG
jgi:hypothetical protein